MKTTQIVCMAGSIQDESKRGVVMVAALLLLGALAIVAVTVGSLVNTELLSSNYYQKEREAFYQAEAGVRYTISRISMDLRNNLVALTGSVENVNYACPEGYSFGAVASLGRMARSTWYTFSVTGYYQNAKSVIEVAVARPRVMTMAGIFGDKLLKVQPNNEVYSYDSLVVANPTPAQSTGQANIGSNADIGVKPGIFLDGNVLLGVDSPICSLPNPPFGYEWLYIGRIDPDPLGANGGWVSDAINYYSNPAKNNNASCPQINNNELVVNSTITLQPGNYYLKYLYVKAGDELKINATPENPVVIWMNGEIRVQPNSFFNQANGRPANFFIFSKSSEPINFQPNGNINAFVYAPNCTDMSLLPNGYVRGVYWGKYVNLQPNGVIYIDTACLNKFQAKNVRLEQWRHY